MSRGHFCVWHFFVAKVRGFNASSGLRRTSRISSEFSSIFTNLNRPKPKQSAVNGSIFNAPQTNAVPALASRPLDAQTARPTPYRARQIFADA